MKNPINIFDWMDKPSNAGMVVAGIFIIAIFSIMIYDSIKEFKETKGPFNDY